MQSEANRFDKKLLAPYFDHWESIREKIESDYQQKDRQAVEVMKTAIDTYRKLLEQGGKELDKRSEKLVYTLLPLNGTERFEFVKAKIDSHYAFIQLDALFSETKKKAARLSIMKK
ncbi:YpoC family protein [Sporosarcina limicola]|uniref:YpoC-like domain-containing protein n=1 Tax=Sporosarcina limicola TaxID=34101 RepID=A0A927R5Q0_9BACL|nr:hypothetical protein [Sporosarcina limicola]MBE1554144.1 hypothetical protein [Sporosarcina limicola]